MESGRANPYQAPQATSVPRGHVRFRLRRWFSATLCLALCFDFFVVRNFGVQPLVVSIPTFMLLLIASVFIRHRARIILRADGIVYRDLVQFIDVSWDRVVQVIHRRGKTFIATDSRLAQITVTEKHRDYKTIVEKITEVQAKLGFEILDDQRSEATSW
ncbi:hypothetical protein SH139x_003067 [Planctomycetaceae bacterium SH139]